MRRVRAAVAAGALVLGAAAGPALAHSGADRRPGATQFDLEVKLSAANQPASAPRVAADRYGNLYVTALQTLPASGDDRSQTKARASSWRWWSSDGGGSWRSLPGPAGEADGKVAGRTSDVATDDAGHTYVVDGNIVLRYVAHKLGDVAFDAVSAAPATGGTPYLAAHGNGGVFLLVGATVFASSDGATTFSLGVPLPGGTDCRLAAGRGTDVYATCLDGAGHVFAYASHDDARTFTRTALATYDTSDTYAGAPPLAVSPDGTVSVLRGDTASGRTTLTLQRSHDGGRTWDARKASDEPYLMTHLSLSAAPDGRLGAAMYIASGAGQRWFVGAGIFAPTAKLLVVSFASHTVVAQAGRPAPDGDTGTAFTPDSRLSVTWTVLSQSVDVDPTPLRDAWFVRSQPPDRQSNVVTLARTPHYEIPPCTIPGQVRAVGDWQQIRAPEFRARDGGAGGGLVAYAVDPYDPRVVFTTNGTSLLRSDDGGCRWTEVWSLETAPTQANPVTAAAGRIVAVAVPEDRREHTIVYAVVAESDRAHVVKSPSGLAGSFGYVDSGLPPSGAPGLFRVSGANPDFLYLTVGNLLYASDDAGASWSLRTAATDVATAPVVDVLAVDPGGPNNLYAIWSGTLHHSRDGGRSWDAPVPSAALQSAAGTLTAVDVWHGGNGERARPTVWSAPAGGKPATVLRSTDDGATWTRTTATGLQGTVESAVHGSGPDVLVVSTLPINDGNAEVYALSHKTHTYVSVTPVATKTPFRVSADRRGHPTFYGLGDTALFRYAGNAIEQPVPPGTYDDSVFTDIAPPVAPAEITPSHADVRLPLGAKTTVPFRVDLAPRRPRIDVMFAIDTSQSAGDWLDGLRPDVLAALHRLAAVADLWVGVAQDKTDEAPPVFRRERDLGPFDASFAAALRRLDYRNSPGAETQLIALDQLVTGAGIGPCPTVVANGQAHSRCLSAPVGTVCEVQPETAGCGVPPGQEADFRDQAVKVVVDVTDRTFQNPEGTPRNAQGRPDVAGVADKYHDAGILHLGLAMSPEAVLDLAPMSRLTGTLAPAGGLDCSGDGVADVRPGAPAVCPGARNLDRVLLALFHAHAPLTHVHVQPPEHIEVSPALRTVSPGEFEDVDRTVPHVFTVAVSVSCVAVAAGHYDIPLVVEPHGETPAPFGIGLDCLGSRVAPRPHLPLDGPHAALPLAVVAPQPPLNLNPQFQPQTQVQVQTGVATQEREEVEPALATADTRDEDAVRLLGGALGLAAAAVVGLRRRTRSAVARR